MILQTIIRILQSVKKKGGEGYRKNDVGTMIVVVFANAKSSYLMVSLFNNLPRPFLF